MGSSGYTDAHAHTYCHGPSHADADSHAHTHRHGYTHADADSHAHTNTAIVAHTDTNAAIVAPGCDSNARPSAQQLSFQHWGGDAR